MAMIKCPECKNKISSMARECPKCGCVISENEKRNLIEKTNKSKKKKKIVFFTIFFVFLLSLVFGGLFLHQNKIKQEQNKIKQEQEKIKQEQVKKDLEEKQKQEKLENHKKYLITTMDFLLGAQDFINLLAQKGYIISKTWNNAIWETKDKSTNKYTMKNGKFVDFNTAVDKCVKTEFSKKKFVKKANEFLDYYEKIKTFSLQSEYVEKYGEYDSWVRELSESINTYYTFLLSPSGNYSEFTDNGNTYFLEIKNISNKLPDGWEDIVTEYSEYKRNK